MTTGRTKKSQIKIIFGNFAYSWQHLMKNFGVQNIFRPLSNKYCWRCIADDNDAFDSLLMTSYTFSSAVQRRTVYYYVHHYDSK